MPGQSCFWSARLGRSQLIVIMVDFRYSAILGRIHVPRARIAPDLWLGDTGRGTAGRDDNRGRGYLSESYIIRAAFGENGWPQQVLGSADRKNARKVRARFC